MDRPRITTFLMFNKSGDSNAAAKFYTSIFKNSRILSSSPMSADVELDGQRLSFFDGGDHFSFSEGISLFVSCKDQAEVDYYWDKLIAGGTPTQCGWLNDKFGVTWQIIPTRLMELLSDPDKARANRAASSAVAC